MFKELFSTHVYISITGPPKSIRRVNTKGNDCGSASKILHAPQCVTEIRIVRQNKRKLAVPGCRMIDQIGYELRIHRLLTVVSVSGRNRLTKYDAAAGQHAVTLDRDSPF